MGIRAEVAHNALSVLTKRTLLVRCVLYYDCGWKSKMK